MTKLLLNLENCFGINKIKDLELDFDESNVVAIYSRNGTMKTSLANTFHCLQKKEKPKDELYNLVSKCDIKLDNRAIDHDEIFVVKSFDESIIGSEEGVTTLLVDEPNKKKYEAFNKKIQTEKASFISDLNKLSGEKKVNIENLLLKVFGYNNFYDFLENIDTNGFSDQYAHLKHSIIFNPDVRNLLDDPDVSANLQRYNVKYREILNNNSLYKIEVFNPTRALSSFKTLQDENFFKVGHKVHIDGEPLSITEAEFKDKLEQTRQAILADAELKKIESAMHGKKSTKEFESLFEKEKWILAKLEPGSIDEFQRDLWSSYIKKLDAKLESLKTTYSDSKNEIHKIEAIASQQGEKWEKLVFKFDSRFSPPFKLEVKDKKSAVLGQSTPNIVFNFKDANGNKKSLDKGSLERLGILSMGERRIYYLLHLMYELESIKNKAGEIVIVIDDIADSFDYKNKYAIIEYLKELSEESNFKLLILTHNFDFFRTIISRLKIPQLSCIHSMKTDSDIVFKADKDLLNPFQTWKDNLNEKNIIALIPLVRNLIEYGKYDPKDYLTLTHLLHKKEKTKYFVSGKLVTVAKEAEYSEANGDFEIQKSENIKFSTLKDIYSRYLNTSDFDWSQIEDTSVFDRILFISTKITESNLEDKIILATGIRLEAEVYMIGKIDNPNFVRRIASSQTAELFTKLKGKIKSQEVIDVSDNNLKHLTSVNTMTPENIHINSFMYEPILDMDINELRDLYIEVKALNIQ